MEKLIRDNKVAVLYSPGWGAGWFTWNTNHPECIFDPEIVKIVLGEEYGNISTIAKDKFGPYFYTGGLPLSVKWIDVGDSFVIEEYDGNETITTKDSFNWIVA